MKPIQIIQGGQYGSEAKGAIAAYLAVRDKVDYAVRTGATNAGHTAYYNGTKFVMQQLPVGWVNPLTRLVIGAGALVDIDILTREIDLVSALTKRDVRRRLVIDRNAYLHMSQHHDRAKEKDRHTKIGATGKGCSEALIDRVRLRGVADYTIKEFQHRIPQLEGITLGDTAMILNDAVDSNRKVQLEGTQGTLLDLLHGPYPYTTHKPTGPAQWMMEAGLSPTLPTEVVMVVRTYPIRVAGNSGPLPQEISWPMLAYEINAKLAADDRADLVAHWAIDEFEAAVRLATSEYAPGDIPEDTDGLDQHDWEDRERYASALSNINATAWRSLPDAAQQELAKLFELTTVTKKLRRIAHLSESDLNRAARLVRPDAIAVTFMNYEFPTRWFDSQRVVEAERRYLDSIESVCEAPVSMITRGPRPEHIVEVR